MEDDPLCPLHPAGCFKCRTVCERVTLQLVYHSLQLVAFALLAILIMRLKLFLTPHMCIMASLICSKQVRLSHKNVCFHNVVTVSPVKSLLHFSHCILIITKETFEHTLCPSVRPSLSPRQLFGWIGEKFKHQIVVFAIMAIMAVQGVANLQAQWAIIGEFSNLPQEELLDWIQDNTQPGERSRLAP